MARNKSHITIENMTEWMCSTGFLFPRNIIELKRFEKLYADVQMDLTGRQVNPEVILGKKQRDDNNSIASSLVTKHEIHFRMAARKGGGNIPQHILDKMKKNHDQNKEDDNCGQEEIPE